jgi:hypothetical protein
MTELPAVREEHGFRRTVCGCEFCKVYCRHLPGTLDPADLLRLCPAGQDVFTWSEEHLRARADLPYPALVPVRNSEGHCHWYFDGRCSVHASAPFGCAFFDAHMPDAEIARRVAATVRACQEDAAANGVYTRVWRHLCGKGLIAPPGDRDGLAAEVRQLRRRAERNRRRLQGG